MSHLYVIWQDEETRQRLPVAKLTSTNAGYLLSYTRGAKQFASFNGLGSMQVSSIPYFSEVLFPFFSNRMISKSRPEYANYLNWLGLDNLTVDPIGVLSMTGGLRATDSFELIPQPTKLGGVLSVDFFVPGLRHLSPASLARISQLESNEQLFVFSDLQNLHDPQALGLRTNDPKMLIGYISRYYCAGLQQILKQDASKVTVKVKRVNVTAPLGMRLLCSLSAPWDDEADFLETNDAFLPLS